MSEIATEMAVLLVEDDDVEAERVKRAFARSGLPFSIRRACDGLDALEILRNQTPPPLPHPFLVLLDLKMPRMDGIQFLDELRADPALHRSVVFVLTTSQNDHDRQRAYGRHIAGYVPKTRLGANFDKFVEMLKRYCSIVTFP